MMQGIWDTCLDVHKHNTASMYLIVNMYDTFSVETSNHYWSGLGRFLPVNGLGNLHTLFCGAICVKYIINYCDNSCDLRKYNSGKRV